MLRVGSLYEVWGSLKEGKRSCMEVLYGKWLVDSNFSLPFSSRYTNIYTFQVEIMESGKVGNAPYWQGTFNEPME